MANKKEDLAGQPDEFLKGVSVHHDAVLLGPAPKVIQDEQAKPEDCIPDLPENKEVRDFLKKAPTKGLWMPLGKEVKVMQCWRCKVRLSFAFLRTITVWETRMNYLIIWGGNLLFGLKREILKRVPDSCNITMKNTQLPSS